MKHEYAKHGVASAGLEMCGIVLLGELTRKFGLTDDDPAAPDQ